MKESELDGQDGIVEFTQKQFGTQLTQNHYYTASTNILSLTRQFTRSSSRSQIQ